MIALLRRWALTAVPLVFVVGGVQLSVAEPLLLPAAFTAMLKDGSEVRLVPSLALIAMPE